MKTFLFCTLFLSQSAVGETPKPSQVVVPLVMYDFLGALISLQPYLVSPQKFSDPKNANEIERRLSELVRNTKRLSHSKRLDTSSFQISAEALQEHLATTRDVFNRGQKDYARRMLNATMTGCSSCHTQVPSSGSPAWKFKANELHGSDFEKAEFLFAVRHYDEALEHFDSVITKYVAKNGNQNQLETALKRKLVIFVRSKQAPDLAMKSFENDLHTKQWPSALKAEVKGWLDALKKITLKKDPTLTAEDLQRFASATLPPLLTASAMLKPGSYVLFLYTSGLIFNFINTHKESEVTPDLLYWLAVCDTNLSQNYFFSLADLYLKECIRRFPQSATASKCYNELESTTIESYTGSSGIHLPEDVRQELEKYKLMLKRPVPI